MQMLSKSRLDGGYPRIVHMGLGIIALARTEAEFKSLTDHANRVRKIVGAVSLAWLAALVIFAWIY